MTQTLRCSADSRLEGLLDVPGDKSISHRAAMLGAIARGTTQVEGFLIAEDTLNTVRAMMAMGVSVEGFGTPRMEIEGVGLHGLQPPAGYLDMGNSGTGMRLLLGVLAGQSFSATLTGDPSLSRRPMDRIAAPLRQMGIRVEGQGERLTPPVTVHGGKPAAIHYDSPVASAQVKSAVLLAGLYAEGVTSVTEPSLSRDHTERMLSAFGAEISTGGDADGHPLSSLRGGGDGLRGQRVRVPGDFSSAAYFIAAALLCPESAVSVAGVILNPTRAALLDVLLRMGAQVAVSDEAECSGERVGTIAARSGTLEGTTVAGEEVPRLIDEVPLLAVLATRARGITEIRDAQELRVKESDRLALMARGLRAMGADVRELADGLVIHGPTPLVGAEIDAAHDHRIAMSFCVAGLVAKGETIITGAESIETSFPEFPQALRRLGGAVEVG